ncbi:MAG: hypothetical protein ACLP5O_13755 [Acidimicrobiales bacterium]
MDRNNHQLPPVESSDAIGWAEAITDHERRKVRLEECEHQLLALTAWARYLEARVDRLSQGAEP